jgi:hypothetical protein
MPGCSGNIGCHYCISFLHILETKMNEVVTSENKDEKIRAVLDLISSFKKGE